MNAAQFFGGVLEQTGQKCERPEHRGTEKPRRRHRGSDVKANDTHHDGLSDCPKELAMRRRRGAPVCAVGSRCVNADLSG